MSHSPFPGFHKQLESVEVKNWLAELERRVHDVEDETAPQYTTIELGHATDTTLARVSAGIISVEGVNLIRGALGSTDNLVPRADGTGGNLLQAGVGLTISDAGEVTNTSQPAFLAYANADVLNQIGTAATGFVTIAFNTEVFDQGSDFASNTFTAPVNGRYHFDVAVLIANLTAAADRADLNLVTSNRTYRLVAHADANRMPQDITLYGSVEVDMDAADTATVQAQVQGEAANTVDIFGSASPLGTFISGHLIC